MGGPFGTAKRGHIVAATLAWLILSPKCRLVATSATFVADTNFVSCAKKVSENLQKHFLCPRGAQQSCRTTDGRDTSPGHSVPDLESLPWGPCKALFKRRSITHKQENVLPTRQPASGNFANKLAKRQFRVRSMFDTADSLSLRTSWLTQRSHGILSWKSRVHVTGTYATDQDNIHRPPPLTPREKTASCSERPFTSSCSSLIYNRPNTLLKVTYCCAQPNIGQRHPTEKVSDPVP